MTFEWVNTPCIACSMHDDYSRSFGNLLVRLLLFRLLPFHLLQFCLPNDVEMRVSKVIEGMKQRAKEETTPVPKIYQQSLQEIYAEGDDEVAAVLPTFSSIRTT